MQLLAVCVIGLGALVWAGIVPWAEISERLGLADDDPRGSLILPADGRSEQAPAGEIRPASGAQAQRQPPARRSDEPQRDGRAADRRPGVLGTIEGPGACGDAAAVARVRSANPGWSDEDVGHVACGRVAEGFTAAHVTAALGSPLRVERGADERRSVWVYADRRITFVDGRAVAAR